MTGTTRQLLRRAQPWLGTLVDVGIVMPASAAASDDAAGSKAIDAAFAAVALVHRLMSFHEADSDVTAINRLQPYDDTRRLVEQNRGALHKLVEWIEQYLPKQS